MRGGCLLFGPGLRVGLLLRRPEVVHGLHGLRDRLFVPGPDGLVKGLAGLLVLHLALGVIEQLRGVGQGAPVDGLVDVQAACGAGQVGGVGAVPPLCFRYAAAGVSAASLDWSGA